MFDFYHNKRDKNCRVQSDLCLTYNFNTDNMCPVYFFFPQLQHILSMCCVVCCRSGLTLAPQELDKVWATLNISTDGMYAYSTLIQHFVNYKVPHEQKENIIFGKVALCLSPLMNTYCNKRSSSERLRGPAT